MDILQFLVDEDVEGFNTQRSPRSPPDLFAADLSGKTLHGVDLSGCNLEKSDLTGADLSEAMIVQTRFAGIDGGELRLVKVTGLRARFREAFLEGAVLDGADLTQSDFAEAVLDKTSAVGVRMVQARLKDAHVHDANWSEAALGEATLNKADFSRSNLTRADLSAASAHQAIFDKARLDGIQGVEARFGNAILTGATLVGARLTGAYFAEADLTGADLTGADLSKANLTKAKLTGAKLAGACLADATLEGVDFTGLDLSDVDLTGHDPVVLGLSESQIQGLSQSGAGAAAEGMVHVHAPKAAVNGASTLVVWDNYDAESPEENRVRSLRWASSSGQRGVLPVGGEGLLAHGVVAVGAGFEVFAVQDRPGGVVIQRWPVTADGGVGAPTTSTLGLSPLVAPVAVGGSSLQVYALSRRGPALSLHQDSAQGFQAAYTKNLATAQSFVNPHHPIVMCKGGVLLKATDKGPAAPLRTPDGFPGTLGIAVPWEDSVATIGFVTGRPGDPGGLRVTVLQVRGTPEPEVLGPKMSTPPASLDAITVGGEVLVSWVAEGVERDSLIVAHWPDGDQARIPGVDLAETVRFAPGPGGPALLVTSSRGARVVGLDGSPRIEVLTGVE